MFTIDYHDATKHHFNRFAPALGYLDWATQPDPFRRYAGAPTIDLPRAVGGGAASMAALYGDQPTPPAVVDAGSVATLLRCSMGLSAWKQYRTSRWALRVNPSSGNLHPTEVYTVWNGQVAHYAARDHLLEQRCTLGGEAWQEFSGGAGGLLVGLTSVHWREAWKYGERAFRYCQHDVGHALAALRFAASLLGWRLMLLPRWGDDHLAAVLGLDRAEDFRGVEPEFPECLAVVTPDDPSPWVEADPDPLVRAARAADWSGSANRLSPSRVEWPLIARVEQTTRAPGLESARPPVAAPASRVEGRPPAKPDSQGPGQTSARDVILRRRSALAFDARSSLSRRVFLSMLRRLSPGRPPFDAIDWPPHVHLVLFVHRIDDLTPGVYAYLRDPRILTEWRAMMRPEFLWEPVADSDDAAGLHLLAPLDVSWEASRLSCDQDIAGAGFFSLGMLARLESSLRQRGEWFYRRLFWECGVIGQVLYLEAEAAGARGTGIGCYYDDPVHDTIGLSGHEWQSLYHFSMGMPVEDGRLTTDPGYPWEAAEANGGPGA